MSAEMYLLSLRWAILGFADLGFIYNQMYRAKIEILRALEKANHE